MKSKKQKDPFFYIKRPDSIKGNTFGMADMSHMKIGDTVKGNGGSTITYGGKLRDMKL